MYSSKSTDIFLLMTHVMLLKSYHNLWALLSKILSQMQTRGKQYLLHWLTLDLNSSWVTPSYLSLDSGSRFDDLITTSIVE